MWVLTIDQRDSQRLGDHVDQFLETLANHLADPGREHSVVRRFERTVGDEVQGVLDDPTAAVDLALTVLRWGGWSVGIGAGPVEVPMPVSARAASGRAFVHARAAVEAAKSRSRPVSLAVRGESAHEAAEAEAVLTLIAVVAARRTPGGWAVVDAMSAARPARQDDVAAALGITQQAVSQRLRAAMYYEEVDARPAAARLLSLAARPGQDQAPLSHADRGAVVPARTHDPEDR